MVRNLLIAALIVAAGAAAAQGTAYVSSEKDSALTLIDTGTLGVKGTIPTCKRARHVQLTAQRQLMVACTDSNQADVIDPATGKSLRRIALGEEPEAFDLSPDGKTIYVSNEDQGELAFVDAATGKTLRVGEGGPGARRREGQRRRQDGVRDLRGREHGARHRHRHAPRC